MVVAVSKPMHTRGYIDATALQGNGGKGGNRSNSGGDTPSNDEGELPPGVSDDDAARQVGLNKNKIAWKDNLKVNKDWTSQQKFNYRRLFKHYKPEEHKKNQIAFHKKEMERLA